MQEQQKAPLLRPLLYLYLHAAAPFVSPPAAKPVFNYLEGHVCVDGVTLVCAGNACHTLKKKKKKKTLIKLYGDFLKD